MYVFMLLPMLYTEILSSVCTSDAYTSDVYVFLKLNIQYLPIFRYDYKWISAK